MEDDSWKKPQAKNLVTLSLKVAGQSSACLIKKKWTLKVNQ
jgi:hypothetical protein